MKIELVSEQRRQALRINDELVAVTVQFEPKRVEVGLLPYIGVYQIIRDGKVVDESDDKSRYGKASWDEAFASLIEAAAETLRKEAEDDLRSSGESPCSGGHEG